MCFLNLCVVALKDRYKVDEQQMIGVVCSIEYITKLYEEGTNLITKQRAQVLVLRENHSDNGHHTMVVSIAGLKHRPDQFSTAHEPDS